MTTYMEFAAVLGLVLLLIWGVAWMAKRSPVVAQLASRTPKKPSLEVLETRLLDMRHKLVVVRWAGVEHLLLLGTQSAVPLAQHPVTLKNDDEKLSA